MNNYIIITKESVILPVADRLQDEGKNVVVGIVNDDSGPTPAKEQRRQSLYDGILDTQPADAVLKMMKSLPNKDDWFFMCD